MTSKRKSFAGQDTPRLVDIEYHECNFMMRQPLDVGGLKVGIRLFPGDDTARTFINCNLMNREVPPNSIIQGGNTAIIVFDVVTSTDSVEVGGETISVDNLSNFCHGRYNPETLEIEYKETPEEIKQDRAV